MREENLFEGLDGICSRCETKQDIPFQEEWHVNTLYKVGCCPGCNYEFSIPVWKG